MSKTTVNNVNVSVYNFQAAYTAYGLGTIPAGTSVAAGVGTIQKAMDNVLKTQWPASYPTFVPNQVDHAIMEPWKDNIGGTAPRCATQAITLDFTSWNLPFSTAAVTQIAKEITQQIANNGGQTGTFYGQTPLTSSETLFWGVAFATAVVIEPDVTGILYSFTAALGLGID